MLHPILLIAVLPILTSSTLIPGTIHVPHLSLLSKRQDACPLGTYDSVQDFCRADDNTLICLVTHDTCCQLPSGNTPYTCPDFSYPFCCGTDKPMCGMDETCSNSRGEDRIRTAGSVITPTPTPTGQASSEGKTSSSRVDPLAQPFGTQGAYTPTTAVGSKGPNASAAAKETGAAVAALGRGREAVVAVIVVAVGAVVV
ncbi:uncharacterized protein K441DRAFT_670497 [Cenococcum geophilum 1.58]|uniref:Uncharacterized protein n=1 Tax=Cenococcum geophilum 1.58 TaxID=794803 RepID=A0ACC8EMW2_9PEZI|nr:hypothetical protein K441DRAFT_670497 [Cenococcum geophilum 1.58]